MTRPSAAADLEAFESHRALLVAHAYRMLGDLGRAEDMVQEAWLRWSGRQAGEDIESPRAYLVTLVTRLCLNELDSARSRREESRADRLPEPVDLEDGGIGRVELMDQISMAFLVMLQRLTPAERAVLLLRDVFDFDYKEIAALVGKNEAACRKLLERARTHVANEKRLFSATPEAHQRLLRAFTTAVRAGDVDAVVNLLAEDAVLISDGGPEGARINGARTMDAPLTGAAKIAAVITAGQRRGRLANQIHQLNGQPAIVFYDGAGAPLAAMLLAISDNRIHRLFFHADPSRLRHLGPPQGPAQGEPQGPPEEPTSGTH
jgi:RNA polymerase sigma-70 factor (ECF subfamily)